MKVVNLPGILKNRRVSKVQKKMCKRLWVLTQYYPEFWHTARSWTTGSNRLIQIYLEYAIHGVEALEEQRIHWKDE